MKTSIFSRIFGAILIVSFIAVTLVTVLNSHDQISQVEESLLREKNILLDFAELTARDDLQNLQNLDFRDDFEFIGVFKGEELIYSRDSEGREVKLSDSLVGIDDLTIKKTTYDGSDVSLLSKSVNNLNGEEGKIILAVQRRLLTDFILPIIARALVIILFATLISVFLALALTERITNPLLDLKKAIKEITGGNLNQNIEIKTGDEIEEIGDEFNRMTKKLQKTREELEEARQILEIRVRARTKELEELNDTLEEKVEARTEELQRKVEELEKFHKLTVGREKKMIELKEKNKKLKNKLKEKNQEDVE